MHQWKLEPARDLDLAAAERFKSLRRESGLLETIAHWGWWALVRTYLGIGHRLTIHGRENLPAEAPFVMVANHTSHLDALVLAAALPPGLWDCTSPVAAADNFFDNPAVAIFAGGVINALPIWRKKPSPHALHELRQRLVEQPAVYILFPEGTRTRDGKLGTFKAGLGMLIGGTSVPVVPCHITGAFEALPPKVHWPRWHRIALRIGKPLLFGDIVNDRPGWKEIGRRAEGAVRNLAGESGKNGTDGKP
jgi:1-acyl-sn-glycerol-3-phosphate acyltransferase